MSNAVARRERRVDARCVVLLYALLGLVSASVASAHASAVAASLSNTGTVSFVDIAAGLPGVDRSSVAWGDYDHDGDLDILITGRTMSQGPIARLYRNDNALVFAKVDVDLQGVSSSSVAWGDFDNDGDLDILLTGNTGLEGTTRIYRNDGPGTFTDIAVALTGVSFGSVAWGDYDNDGDLDILLTGFTGSEGTTIVYRNDGNGAFASVPSNFPGVSSSSVAWGDYDNDGDLDVLLTGGTGSERIARVYRNDGTGVFADIATGLPGISGNSVAWGDYDNDGDLDILLAGRVGFSESIARVYRNDGNDLFTDVAAGLQGVYAGSVTWGDYDNDGDLDILLAGWTEPGTATHVYRNEGAGSFFDIAAGLTGVWVSSVAWGDCDNDGDLDILLTGDTGSERITRIYRNDGGPGNTPPTTPGGLSAFAIGNLVTLSWNAATDAQTLAPGLSYNLRIGTTPGGSEVIAGMAHMITGYRSVVALGNAQQRTSWTVRASTGGPYYWSVQALDGAFAGSSFAPEEAIQPVGVPNEAAVAPFALQANAPNPFGPYTALRYDLPSAARVKLVVFDTSGRIVRVLVDRDQVAGTHAVFWDGINDSGGQAASGVYVCRMEAGPFQATARMTLLK
jgi:hypothetical protein